MSNTLKDVIIKLSAFEAGLIIAGLIQMVI